MSEPMTNVEIEDVLSSIRRLVSEDLRPAARRADPRPVKAPPPVSVDPAPGSSAPDPLVLTAAQRVEGDGAPPPHAAPGSRIEAEVAASDDFEPDGSEVMRRSVLDWAVEDSYTVDDYVEPVFQAVDRGQGARDAVFAHRGASPARTAPAPESPAVEGADAEASAAEARDTAADATAAPDAADAPTAAPQEPLTLATPAPEVDAPAEDRAPTAEADAIDWEDMPAAAPAADTSAPETEMLEAEPEDGTDDPDEGFLDEAMLRDLVRSIIREELQGALGERITRNVRKLVRAEINRALTAREFE